VDCERVGRSSWSLFLYTIYTRDHLDVRKERMNEYGAIIKNEPSSLFGHSVYNTDSDDDDDDDHGADTEWCKDDNRVICSI